TARRDRSSQSIFYRVPGGAYEEAGADCGHNEITRVLGGRSVADLRRVAGRIPRRAQRTDAARRRIDRDYYYFSSGGGAVCEQANRAAYEFCEAGRHRYRERSATERIASAHHRPHRILGAADWDRGGAQGHLKLAWQA